MQALSLYYLHIQINLHLEASCMVCSAAEQPQDAHTLNHPHLHLVLSRWHSQQMVQNVWDMVPAVSNKLGFVSTLPLNDKLLSNSGNLFAFNVLQRTNKHNWNTVRVFSFYFIFLNRWLTFMYIHFYCMNGLCFKSTIKHNKIV